MKRKFLSFAIAFLFLILFSLSLSAGAVPVSATTNIDLCPTGDSQFNKLCDLSESSLGDVVNLIVIVLLIVAVVISLFFLIFGGIKWILSGGDKGGVEAARNMIIAAIVGLILAFLAYFILNLVLGFFDLDIKSLELPTVLSPSP